MILALSARDFPRNLDFYRSEGGGVSEQSDPGGRAMCEMFRSTGMRMDERAIKPEVDHFGQPILKKIWGWIIGATHP